MIALDQRRGHERQNGGHKSDQRPQQEVFVGLVRVKSPHQTFLADVFAENGHQNPGVCIETALPHDTQLQKGLVIVVNDGRPNR